MLIRVPYSLSKLMPHKLPGKLLRLFPLQCAICELESETGIGICKICNAQLPWIESACYQCGLPVAERLLLGGRCGRCIMKCPEFDSCQALFHYRPPLDRLIIQHKFQRRLDIGASLGWLLGERLHHCSLAQAARGKPELLLPVPLHRARMNRRGFNQAWELTRAASKASGIPSCNGMIERIRDTTPQTELADATARRKNLKAAFAARDPEAAGNVSSVTIIDDVVTTASTVNAMAACLKQQGIRRVDVYCVARANIRL
jgi:ComF family protein